MKSLLSALVLVLLSVVASASDAFTQANEDYEAGRYDQAIEAYEKLLEEGPRVSVLNNLGSAHFRSEDYGRAILAFERALVLSPGDKGISANLKLAQDQAAVYPSENPQRSFLQSVGISRGTLAMVALVTSVLLPIGALLLMILGKRSAWVLSIVGLNVVILKLALQPMKHDEDPSLRGIVVAKMATVRLSPFEKAEDRGELASGREVTLGEYKNGYFWVDGSSGSLQGWVSEDEVARVVPRSDEPES